MRCHSIKLLARSPSRGASFKMSLDAADQDLVLKWDCWPQGIIGRPFREGPNQPSTSGPPQGARGGNQPRVSAHRPAGGGNRNKQQRGGQQRQNWRSDNQRALQNTRSNDFQQRRQHATSPAPVRQSDAGFSAHFPHFPPVSATQVPTVWGGAHVTQQSQAPWQHTGSGSASQWQVPHPHYVNNGVPAPIPTMHLAPRPFW